MQRRPRVMVVLAGIAMIVGGVGAVASSAPTERRITETGHHYAPSLVADPGDPGTLALVEQRVDDGVYGCVWHRSADGGSTWRTGDIDVPADAPPGDDNELCLLRRTHALAFDADGTLWTAFLVRRTSIYVAGWPAGADGFGPPTRVAVLADQVSSSAPHAPAVAVRDGTVAIAWGDELGVHVASGTRGAFSAPSLVEPDGRDPVIIAGAGRFVLVSVVPDPEACGLEFERARCHSLVVARTAEDASRFGAPVTVSRAPGRSVGVSATALPDGGVVVAWDDSRSDPNPLSDDADRDVLAARSIDGSEWTTTLHVNVRRGPVDLGQVRPAVAVGPGASVHLAWYDARHAPTIPGMRAADVQHWDVYETTSTDAGASWSPARRVTSRTTEVQRPSGLGLVARGGAATVVWEDGRRSTPQGSARDLFLGTAEDASVEVLGQASSGPGPRGPVLPATGASAATAIVPGVALVAIGAVLRRTVRGG